MRTNPVVHHLASFLVPALIPLAAVPAAPPDLVDVRVSVRPLDLTRPPTTAELMAAGQLGGPLHPAGELADKARERRVNLDFGRAIQSWNDHAYPRAVTLFRQHIERFPDSPWVAEAKLHIGCDAQYQGRYREARATFEGLIEDYGAEAHPGARMIANKARLRLGGLLVLQYDLTGAMEQFRLLKTESPDWRHRTYAAHWIQRLARYRGQESALLTCGTEALANLLEVRGKSGPARALRDEMRAAPAGQSVVDLIRLAERHGEPLQARRLRAAELARLPLPAILHLPPSMPGGSGHYWIVEREAAGTLHLFDPQSGRRFRQSTSELQREWDGLALVASGRTDLPGRPLDPLEVAGTRGGCCGAPMRENDLGNEGVNNWCAPGWRVNMINMNFFVGDTPLWYTPPYGPKVEIRLSYNSQSAIAYHEPFGPKWQFNYATYMVIDTGGTVTIFMPDGRRDVYTPDGAGGFNPPYAVYDELVPVGPDRFELRRIDGSVHVFAMPRAAGGGLVTQYFLEALRDRRGLALTFSYDTDGRLVSITDAPGRVSTLSYGVAGLVTRVTDPFGRTADFEYDAEGNLSRITDMGGYASSFGYDADRYITLIDGARGRWQFRTEPADGVPVWSDAYPPPGEPMWANYRITVTDPLGDPYEYFYYGGCEAGYGCAGYSWIVRPRDYIPWRSLSVNTFNSQAPKTRFIPVVTGGGKGEIGEIQTPEGRRWTYSYDAFGNLGQVQDGAGHATTYTHGGRGSLLSVTRANGAETTYTWSPDGRDLVSATDGLGTVSYGYNTAGEVTSITDRLGHTTTASYNAQGQMTTITDPLGVVTTFSYGAGAEPEQGVRGGQTIFRRTYDARGRVATHTDATGLTLSIAHDDLDRITAVTFPDGLGRSYTYSGCCVEQLLTSTDRAGLTTRYAYDGLSRLTAIHHPDGSVARNEYDRNDNVVRRIDPAGHATRYEYDLDDYLVRRIFADGASESYTRGHAGHIELVTNARGQENVYSRDEMHWLTGIAFGDGAPPVSYAYDAFGRIVSRQDGLGTAAYTYDAESRRTGIDGPFAADGVTMQYDAAGRLTQLAIEGGASTGYVWDLHGRLQSVTHGGRTSTYEYPAASPLPAALVHPSGVRTTFAYDALNRVAGITHRKADLALIASSTYAYDASGRRTSDVSTGGLAPPVAADQQTTAEFDAVNALLSTADPAQTYAYDADGNQTRGRAPNGQPFAATYDTENHLTSLEYADGGHLLRNEYGYDGDGWLARIVERTDGAVVRERRFVRGPRLFLQERDGVNAVVAELVWNPLKPGGIGGLLQRRSGAADYSFLNDAAGNVTAVVDATQAVVASYRYDPFGQVESASGALAQDFRFQAKFLDPRSDLLYFGFRWSVPGEGRWLTRDPLRERAGLHLYGFVGNDPLNRQDPWGLMPPGSELPPPPESPPPPPRKWGVYQALPGGGGVCYQGSGPPPNYQRPWYQLLVGHTWAWIQAFLGVDAPDSGYSNDPGNSGSNGVRAEGDGSGDNGPNAVAGVRG